MTEHAILCAAYIGPVEQLQGAEPSGPCDCGAEEPRRLPTFDEVQEVKKNGIAEAMIKDDAATACADSRSDTGAQSELPFDPEPLVEEPPKKAPKIEVDSGVCGDRNPFKFEETCSLPKGGHGETTANPHRNGNASCWANAVITVPVLKTEPTSTVVKTEPTPANDAEKPKRKRRTKAEMEAARAAEATKACVACSGSGKSSKGDVCSPCRGTGKQRIAEPKSEPPIAEMKLAEKPAEPKPVEAKPEPPKPDPQQAAPPVTEPNPATVPEKPKRKRRTKAEMEAARTAEAAKTGQEETPTAQPKTGSATIDKSVLDAAVQRAVQAALAQLAPKQTEVKATPDASDTIEAGPRRRFIGIDPGLSGHQVVLDEDMKTIVRESACPVIKTGARKTHDMQGISDEVKEWKKLGVDTVLLEAQQPFPRIGSIGNFIKGVSKGSWEMALTAHGFRFDTIRPISWKKAMGIAGGDPKAVKRRAIEKAQRLFPGVDLRDLASHPKSKKLSSDKAEALLLSLYVARVSLGSGPGTEAWEVLESAKKRVTAPLEGGEKILALNELKKRLKKITKAPREGALLKAAIKRAKGK